MTSTANLFSQGRCETAVEVCGAQDYSLWPHSDLHVI